jgi:uncharacterized RDD family membrane protein YckC
MTNLTSGKYATFAKRLFAYNIDMTLFLAALLPLSWLIDSNRWLFVVVFSLVCLYHAIMESSAWQATVGKKYAKLEVVDANDERISFAQGLVRILMKFVSLIILFCGYLMIYFRKDRRGLHDVVAKTYVVSK